MCLCFVVLDQREILVQTTDHKPQAMLNFDDSSTIMPRRPSTDDAEMDITPMIDITFLLLIFFLVASKMDAAADVELPAAKHGGAVPDQSTIVVTVSRGDGDEAYIYKGNGEAGEWLLTSTTPEDQQLEIAAYIQEQLDSDPLKENVMVKAERGIKTREAARVAQAVGSVEDVHDKGIQLHFAVLEVQ